MNGTIIWIRFRAIEIKLEYFSTSLRFLDSVFQRDLAYFEIPEGIDFSEFLERVKDWACLV